MRNKHRFVQLLHGAQRRLGGWIAEHTAALNAEGQALPTPAQCGVLFLLARQDGQSMGQLAQALDLGAPALSGLVQRMEASGWVQRRSDGVDARSQRVWMRPAGQALLPLVQRSTQALQRALCQGFTPAELDVVARWLAHVQHLDLPSSSSAERKEP